MPDPTDPGIAHPAETSPPDLADEREPSADGAVGTPRTPTQRVLDLAQKTQVESAKLATVAAYARRQRERVTFVSLELERADQQRFDEREQAWIASSAARDAGWTALATSRDADWTALATAREADWNNVVQQLQFAHVEERLQAIGRLFEQGRSIAEDRWRNFQPVAWAYRRGPQRRNRLDKRIDRLLCRMRSPGVAIAIARSGLWRKELRTGDISQPRESSLFGYARAGATPHLSPRSLFDHRYYLSANPDIAQQRLSPLAHYVLTGDAEGRSPHPLISAKYYRAHNTHALGETGLTVLQHFLAFGAAEGRNPHPLFDIHHYVGQLSDPHEAECNPLVHYLRVGWRRGLNPHPLFANDWYLQRYPDVAAAMMPPLVHYVLFGAKFGNDPHPLFHSRWYSEAYADVASHGPNPLEHFLEHGLLERRNPNPHFSTAYYLSQAPDLAPSGGNPLQHYIDVGAWRGLSPLPAFDPIAFMTSSGGTEDGRHTPLELWIEAGAPPREALKSRLGAVPEIVVPPTLAPLSRPPQKSYLAAWENHLPKLFLLFDEGYYRQQVGDAVPIGKDALSHYRDLGWRAGLNPHPLFDGAYYLERYPDVLALDEPPLLHFVVRGGYERRSPHPMFDAEWYCERYPDVEEAGENPLLHYVVVGGKEGRSPGPNFDAARYLRLYPDVAAAEVNPLVHLLTFWPADERKGWPLEASIAGPEGSASVYWFEQRALALSHLVEDGLDHIRTALDADDLGDPMFMDQAAAARVLVAQDMFDEPAYQKLVGELAGERKARMKAVDVSPPPLIAHDPGMLRDISATLSFSNPSAPEVSIIIPAFNNAKYTLECLSALKAAGDIGSAEIIVIDDASSDRTTELVTSIPGLRYIRNDVNQGFLRTCNRAAGEARGGILVFLNNDTQVCPGWLGPLVGALNRDPKVGAVAPKLIFPDGRLLGAGARLDPEGRPELIGMFDDPDAPRYAYPRPVDYASGACLAVRRSDFGALSGFDVQFAPASCEDVDFCLRLRARGLKILYEPQSVVIHHLSVTSNAVAPAYKTQLVVRNQQRLVERWSERLELDNDVRVVAFYLPQFHRIPENDRWWGGGFTEWTNVARALPNYRGHYQPHLPGELGYYNLLDPGVMERQADLARKYGVHGFCYYYYWFSGRRILEKPLERLLETGQPDLPFMLCWANENWTRTWDGLEKDVLLAQKHLPGDAEAFIKDIEPYLRMENYIRIDGRPVLAVYRPGLIPDLERVVEIWRTYARHNGIGELYLTFVETFEHARTMPRPQALGFDASIEFPPASMAAPIHLPGSLLNPGFQGLVNDYHEVVRAYLREPTPAHTRFRGVMPSSDNTARRQDRSYVYHNATPGAFQAWLEAIFEETRRQNHGDERLVFVNAWNEWAEGAHLEPDLRFGHGWLEAIRNAHESQSLVRKVE